MEQTSEKRFTAKEVIRREIPDLNMTELVEFLNNIDQNTIVTITISDGKEDESHAGSKGI